VTGKAKRKQTKGTKNLIYRYEASLSWNWSKRF